MKGKIVKILLLVRCLNTGGGEKVVLEVLKRLDRERIHITLVPVLGGGPWEDKVPSWVAVKPLLQWRGANPLGPIRIFQLALKIPYLISLVRQHDIIWSRGGFGGAHYLGALASFLTRKPLIAWAHGAEPQVLRTVRAKGFRAWLHRHFIPLAYKKARLIMAVSQGVKDELSKDIDGIKERIEVVYNPVDVDAILIKAKEPLPSNITPDFFAGAPVIIAIGRFEFRKGYDLLIKAHASLLRQGLNVKLLLVGGGPEYSSLENMVRRLGTLEKTAFLDRLDNPYPLLARSSILAFPSRAESFGVVLIEAMALGIPVVAADCPSGPFEVLDGGKYGFLVPPEDPEALAGAMADILNNREMSERFTELGPLRAKDFAASTVIARLEKLLLDFADKEISR
ncbi:glycosyltransferase [Neomoorella thermoacetica]|uniref:glycosyltransferase n=1 Tax=Neomoorella thermoacetica TaxID=1525 RepID=UPI0008FB612F|nr:glycosyltransferase [Moorella thermoacetica]OIQ60435.1 4-alpha-N-acetylgalactosaminyltransferase [Moorella thermoacetica]